MKKIKFFTNIPAPYRIEFFNKLGKKVDLTVVFEAERNNSLNRNWYSGKIETFKAVFLKKGAIEEKRVNFKIFSHINKNQDFLIFTNYSYFTEMAGLIWAKLNHIPYCLEVDGALLHKESKTKFWLKSFLIRGAQIYFSTSQSADEFLIHYGADKKKIKHYPFSSVSDKDILKQIPSESCKQNLRKQLGIKEHQVIVAVGQFIYRKGFDILLSAAQNFSKEIGVYIIGGKPTEEYQKICAAHNLNQVYFIDFKSKEELQQFYQAADLFVFPTREDIWGLVVNEAMANGLPVLTTERCVAGLELIHHGENGYIIPPDDSETLVENVEAFFGDSTLQHKMANAALNTIRRYSIENMVDVHLKIFEGENIYDKDCSNNSNNSNI